MTEPRVLHQTEGWLVIDKPAGWHVSAQQRGDLRTVEAWLQQHVAATANVPEHGLVNRLDAGTSGCVVVALSAGERTRLRQLFAAKAPASARKIYVAVCRRGLPRTGRFVLHFTGRHKSSAKVTVRPQGEANTRGECVWSVLGPSRFLGHDVLQVELVGPGRRHQIRAGLAFGGHPLLGDALYGGAPGAPCPALHARSIEIDGITVESVPDDRFALAAA